MPTGLKRVSRRLADGSARVHWYHRATGKALEHDPASAAGLMEVAALDARARAVQQAEETSAGTYAALWTAYRASAAWRALKPRTRSDYQAVRDWLGPAADRMIVAAVTRAQITRLRDSAELKRGRRFGNYVVQVLRLTWSWAIARDLAKVNPLEGMKLTPKPKGESAVNRAWTAAEVEAYFHACPPQLVTPAALGLFAGMRQGDALRVTWSGYDGFTLKWTAGKNGEACTAPVGGVFKAILDDAKGRRGAAVQIALTSAGTPWSESGFRASFFKRIRALAKAKSVQPGLTFHGLRHTIGAMARDGNHSDSRVAAAIGDRSTAMAAIYGRDADRASAQTEVLSQVQGVFAGMEWRKAT